jgi:membrane carboxypeptidase/penicillin-binding protein PbpC
MLAAVEHVRGVLPIGSSDALIAPPPELHRHEICAVSGLAAGDACPTRAMEWLSDADASQRCTWHHQMDGGVLTVWPVELRDWARKEGLQVEPTMTTPIAVPVLARRGGGGSRVSPAIDRLKIARPLGGAVFSIDPTLRKEFQTLALAAQSRDAGVLDWFVDGEHVGQAPHDDAVRWPLARGRHVIVVRDARGASDRVTIEVR